MTTSFSLVHPSVNTVAVSLPTLTVSDKSNEYLRSDQMQLEDLGWPYFWPCFFWSGRSLKPSKSTKTMFSLRVRAFFGPRA